MLAAGIDWHIRSAGGKKKPTCKIFFHKRQSATGTSNKNVAHEIDKAKLCFLTICYTSSVY